MNTIPSFKAYPDKILEAMKSTHGWLSEDDKRDIEGINEHNQKLATIASNFDSLELGMHILGCAFVGYQASVIVSTILNISH